MPCRICFGFILFSALIVFDIFAILNAIEPLVSGDSMDLSPNNTSTVDTTNGTSPEEEAIIRLIVKKFMDMNADNITQDLMAEMEIYPDWVALGAAYEPMEVTLVKLELVAIVLLLLLNLLALLGLKRRQACLLVPWMIVYFTGVCASYLRALILFIKQLNEKHDSSSSINMIFYSLGTGIVFNLAWLFVLTIFKELLRNQEEGRHGPAEISITDIFETGF